MSELGLPVAYIPGAGGVLRVWTASCVRCPEDGWSQDNAALKIKARGEGLRWKILLFQCSLFHGALGSTRTNTNTRAHARTHHNNHTRRARRGKGSSINYVTRNI